MKIQIFSRRALVACASVALGALISSPVLAGTIVSNVVSVSGPGLGFASVPAIVTGTPDNDNQVGGGPTDNNIVIPLKRFDNSAYIDIEFEVAPSNGTTEYKVIEFVDNDTSSPWIRYEMQLGFGTGANFVPSSAGDWIDFDHPNFDTPPTSAIFPVVTTSEDTLVFSGATHSTGAHQYEFRLDIGNPSTGGPATFTLRQIPVVPEPASLALVGLALAGLGVIRRR